MYIPSFLSLVAGHIITELLPPQPTLSNHLKLFWSPFLIKIYYHVNWSNFFLHHWLLRVVDPGSWTWILLPPPPSSRRCRSRVWNLGPPTSSSVTSLIPGMDTGSSSSDVAVIPGMDFWHALYCCIPYALFCSYVAMCWACLWIFLFVVNLLMWLDSIPYTGQERRKCGLLVWDIVKLSLCLDLVGCCFCTHSWDTTCQIPRRTW
jgi:hypothetical protein